MISAPIVSMFLFFDLVLIMRAIHKEDLSGIVLYTIFGVLMTGYVTLMIVSLCANPH